ncbi:MAG: hypothetical protein HYX53_12490 [Chloroflexi bacterium]|nr:hypothetical protein [Chloroflexota bacterium]
MRFRLRSNQHLIPAARLESGGSASESAVAVAEASAPARPTAPAPAPAAAHAVPPSIANRLAASTQRSQYGSGDVRAERLVRQVRGEMAELRETFEALRAVPEDLTAVDLDAIAANPGAATALPPAMLIRALIATYESNRRLERKVAKLKDETDSLRGRVRDLKQDRAWFRGRMETLDDVIEALHANIDDLRHHRDNTRPVAAPAQPRALRASGQAPGVAAVPAPSLPPAQVEEA